MPVGKQASPASRNFVYVLCALSSPITLAATFQASVEQLASLYSLTTSTSIPFPTATLPSTGAQSFIVSDWSLEKGRIQDGSNNLAFVNDPFPDKPVPVSSSTVNTSGPVLQVTYPAGAFASTNSGAQFYNLWNTSDQSTFGSMLVTYEVAFDAGYDWVKGGKLPGLRGGLNSTGCSGGNAANGQDCFSTRVMWRQNGAGEVYAYIPASNSLCSTKGIVCNPEFGISISRGSFGFVSGQWNRVTVLVRLNEPSNLANGNIQLFFNDMQAINQQNVLIRTAENLTANGFYFSTFYGGNDASWAPAQTTHSYFRNVRMWASKAPSNLTGQAGSAGSHHAAGLIHITGFMLVIALVVLCI